MGGYTSQSKTQDRQLSAPEKTIEVVPWDRDGTLPQYEIILSKDAEIEPNGHDTVFGRFPHQVTVGETPEGYKKISKYMMDGEILDPGPGIGQTGISGTDAFKYSGEILKVRDPQDNLQIIDGSRGGTISKPGHHFDRMPEQTQSGSDEQTSEQLPAQTAGVGMGDPVQWARDNPLKTALGAGLLGLGVYSVTVGAEE